MIWFYSITQELKEKYRECLYNPQTQTLLIWIRDDNSLFFKNLDEMSMNLQTFYNDFKEEDWRNLVKSLKEKGMVFDVASSLKVAVPEKSRIDSGKVLIPDPSKGRSH
jgi:hypothetical protein